MKTLKLILSTALFMTTVLVAPVTAQAASQCNNTSWQQSHGRTCANTGLDSNRAVCDGGPYAVYCDDTRTEIRTCRSNKRCNNRGGNNPNAYFDNYGGFNQNLPIYGSQNGGSRDYETFHGKQFHCTEWDYKKNRPCKRGKFNEDCKGSCS